MVLTHARRLRTFVFALLGAAAVAVVPSSVMAGQHTTLASFQAATRGNTLLEPFNGADAFMPSLAVSGGGYSYVVDVTAGSLERHSGYVRPSTNITPLRLTFTGRPVTAFAATIGNTEGGYASATGELIVQTNTGEQFVLQVPVGGMFFGFTTSTPFTSLTVDNTTPFLLRYETLDNVYVGVSAIAAEAADECDNAPVLTLIDSNVFPFTTVGATAQAIGGVCDGATDTGADVWYRFVATSTGLATITTCGCDFDSILRVFGSCLIAGSGQHLACNDDFCTGGGAGFSRASRVQLRVDAGSDYLIRISGFNGASGSGNLTITLLPDCGGDFNHSGGLEVQDIFDFLNRWFAGCP